MFFNVDILSRRKSSLGIVWLAATLGKGNAFRKLNKKEVANVDIERVCQTVISPTEPMALRLSSQLMHGIVRVYVQQNELWMNDVTNAHAAVRKVLMSDGTVNSTANVDLPPNQRRARKEQITLPEDHDRLLPQYYGAFDFDAMAWELAPLEQNNIYGDFEPDRASQAGSLVSLRHTVDLAKITLPSASLMREDARDRELDYHGPAGIGLGLDFGEDGEQPFDLGLQDDREDWDRERDLNDELPPLDDYIPPLVDARPPSARDRLSDIGGSIRGCGHGAGPGGLGISSSDVGRGFHLHLESMPPLDDDRPYDVDMHDAQPTTFSQMQEDEDRRAMEESINSLEAQVLLDAKAHAQRRGKSKGKKRVSFADEDPRIELTDGEMRNGRENYKKRMISEQAATEAKPLDRQTQKEAQALLRSVPAFGLPGTELESLWKETVGHAESKLEEQKKAWKANLPALLEQERVEHGTDRGAGRPNDLLGAQAPIAGDFEPYYDELPPLEDDRPDEFPPLNDHPMLPANEPDQPAQYFGPSDSFSGSAGVARGMSVASDHISERVPLPWNLPEDDFPVDRTRDDPSATFRSFSMAGTPTGMGSRAFPRDSSLSQLSGRQDSTTLRAGRDSVLGQHEGATFQDGETELLGNADGTAGQSQLQVAQLRQETENFYAYTRRIAANLPHNQALFFSDLVPIADSSPTVAAQAFIQLLTLTTNRRLHVKQDEAYGEIEIDFAQTSFIGQEPTASLTA